MANHDITRERVLTEAGHQYTIEMKMSNFRTGITRMNRIYSNIDHIATSDDSGTLYDYMRTLDIGMVEIANDYGALCELTDDHADLDSQYEAISQEYDRVIRDLTKRLSVLRQNNNDNVSRSSRRSFKSNQSSLYEEAAVIKAKLQFAEREAQAKAQLEQLQLQKELAVVEAKIGVNEDSLGDKLLELNERTPQETVTEYLRDVVQEMESQESINITTKPTEYQRTPAVDKVMLQESTQNGATISASQMSGVAAYSSVCPQVKTSPGRNTSNTVFPVCQYAQTQNITRSATDRSCMTAGNVCNLPRTSHISSVIGAHNTQPRISTLSQAYDVHPATCWYPTYVDSHVKPVTAPIDSFMTAPVNVSTVYNGACRSSYLPESRACPVTVNNQSCKPVDSMVQPAINMYDVMTLPKVTLQKFDGDPLKYFPFMLAFDNSVDRSSAHPGLKLNRLLEHCTGKAAKVIASCAIMEPSAGYEKARRILQERFGNKWCISETWVKRITNGPVIKSNEPRSLEDLADDVRCCVENLKAMNMLDQVDSHVRMQDIRKRLPEDIDKRWRIEAVAECKATGQYPNIEKFVEFLETVASEQNDPWVGVQQTRKLTPRDEKPTRNNRFRNKGVSFNVQSSEKTEEKHEECIICQGAHQLEMCKVFIQMSSDDRLDKAYSSHLCYNCLRRGKHRAKWCRKKSTCQCGEKHHKLLHEAVKRSADQKRQHSSGTKKQNMTEVQSNQAQSFACVPSNEQMKKICLPIVPVKIRGRGQQEFIITHALLDPGSNQSFCSAILREKLNLQGKPVTLSLETLNTKAENEVQELDLEIQSTGRAGKRPILKMNGIYAVDKFPCLSNKVDLDEVMKKYDYLQSVPFQKSNNTDMHVIIGQDVPEALLPLEVRHGSSGEPYATRTMLGWALNGPISGQPGGAVSAFIHSKDVDLDRQVERFWKLDSEVRDEPEYSVEDRKVMQLWDQQVTKKDGHYVLPIPFKRDKPDLPDNKVIAEQRLKSLGKRLMKNPVLLENYKSGITELIEANHAEPAPEEPGKNRHVWYIPHHNVVNPRKPNKFRIVFDCAVRYQECLNEQVCQGPNLMNSLIGVLLRFRENKIAIQGDIKGMFLQVKVPPEQRDVLRFLWWRNGEIAGPIDTYRMTTHLFGGVWSPSCAAYACYSQHKITVQDMVLKLSRP